MKDQSASVSQTSSARTLAVIGHDYLRHEGLIRMKEIANILVLAPPQSTLHQLADFSQPISSLDITGEELQEHLKRASERGIEVNGIVSLRDGNVWSAAQVAELNGWVTCPSSRLAPLRNKHTVRNLVNHLVPDSLQTVVRSIQFEKGLLKRDLMERANSFLNEVGGHCIVKPTAGSCKTHVHMVSNDKEVQAFCELYQRAHDYRGGAFVLEEFVHGREMSVETIVQGGEVQGIFVTGYLNDPSSSDGMYERGHYAPASLSAEQDASIRSFIVALHKTLGLDNIVTHTEIFLPYASPLKPALVEINPRIAGDLIGSLLWAQAKGVNFYGAAASIALGQPIEPEHLGVDWANRYSLVRFADPAEGVLEICGSGTEYLKGPWDQLRLLFPAGTAFADRGLTNDDRPALVTLCGSELDELIHRSQRLIRTAVRIG